MPNYCYNSLMIHGDRSELDEFYQKLIDNDDGEVRLLETFLPTPAELIPEPTVLDNGTVIQTMSDEQYAWCVNTWGTKWPEGDVEVDDFPTSINVRFFTAWSPPVAGIKAIAKLFPTFEFVTEWSEDGMGFVGASYHKGDIEIVIDEEIKEIDGDAEGAEYWDAQGEAVANQRDELGFRVLEEGRALT